MLCSPTIDAIHIYYGLIDIGFHIYRLLFRHILFPIYYTCFIFITHWHEYNKQKFSNLQTCLIKAMTTRRTRHFLFFINKNLFRKCQRSIIQVDIKHTRENKLSPENFRICRILKNKQSEMKSQPYQPTVWSEQKIYPSNQVMLQTPQVSVYFSPINGVESAGLANNSNTSKMPMPTSEHL